MEIFIDESGTFITTPTKATISAVGALTVSEEQLQQLIHSYARIRGSLPKNAAGEVKGKLLNEVEIARVVGVALRSGALYEATVTECKPASDAAIRAYQKSQCESMTRQLTERHSAEVKEQAWAMRRQLEGMSTQLYLQSVAACDVVWNTLRMATNYYVQREPRTLSRYVWTVDAKEATRVTAAEDWWRSFVPAYIQTRSLQIRPFLRFLPGCDYSHFVGKRLPMPDHLVEAFPNRANAAAYSLGPLLSEIRFVAAALLALEVVDVLTNAVRRAIAGRLQRSGWGVIPQLMVHRHGCYLSIDSPSGEDPENDPLLRGVLTAFRAGGRSCFALRS